MQLRGYQQEAIDAVYRHLRDRADNPCVVIPTAGGKTPILATLCRDAVERWNGRVLVVSHVKELLAQAVEKLKAIAPELSVGVYSAGLKRRDTDHSVIVAGIQSIYKRACELDAFDLIIVDEAHLITVEGDGMYRQFLADAKVVSPHVRVIGLTATPYRLGSGPICAEDHFLNSICYEVGIRELIRDGYLCPPNSKSGKAKADTSGLHIRGGEFIAGEVEDLMDQEALVEAACEEIVERTRDRNAVLIFAAGVEHGRNVVKTLEQKHDIECGFVCGDTPNRERDELLARFRGDQSDGLFERKPLKFLCNVNVLTTGFDAPNIDCVVLLRPTASPGLYYQMCLDENTEVLTSDGWKGPSEVSVGDTVGAFDMKTSEIVWTPALNKVHRKIAPNESMFGIDAPHLDVRVTNNHTMVYRSRSKSCKYWNTRPAVSLAKMRDTYYVPVAGANEAEGVDLSDDELRFLGWTLTDGHRNQANNAVYISQSADSPYHDDIRSALKGCGFGFSVCRIPRKGELSKYADNVVYCVPYGQPRGERRHLRGWSSLADFLNQPILQSLSKISRRQLAVLLAAMNLGDGAKPKNLPWTRRTITLCLGDSKFLVDQLQILCILRGYRCNVASQRTTTSWHSGPAKTQYVLHIRPQLAATVGGSRDWPNRLVKKRSKLKATPFSSEEMVWCLTTEPGTLVTRRNGKVIIVGNCGRGFRLHPDKHDCLVLDYGGNVVRHGPLDQIEVKPKSSGNGEAPAKECPECDSVVAAGYANCPDCGYEFPPPERGKHETKASEEGVLSGQVSLTRYSVTDVYYSVHTKRDADEDAPKTMRVDYQIGFNRYQSEWVCFEHSGYARNKAVAWWTQRSPDPIPDTAQRAVEIAQAGGVADCLEITVRSVSGEQYDRIVGYALGEMPEPVEVPFSASFEPDDIPF